MQQMVKVASASALTTRTCGDLTELSLRTRLHVRVSLEVNNNAGDVVVQARTVGQISFSLRATFEFCKRQALLFWNRGLHHKYTGTPRAR